MHRRQFIQTLIIATSGVIAGCNSTPSFVKAKRKGNQLYIPIAEFARVNVIQIAHEKRAIGITKLADERFSAVLLSCTHMGCAVDVNNNDVGFVCPCHGAKFSSEGVVVKGPAEENLKQFPVSSTAEYVIVHLS